MSVDRSIIGTMENKVEIVFTREQVAKATMLDLTDDQWIYLAGELETGFDFYFEDQILRAVLYLKALICLGQSALIQ